VRPPRDLIFAAGLAAVIAIISTLPMFGVRWVGIGFIVFALPGMTIVTALAGNVHSFVAVSTLVATFAFYLGVFSIVARIVRVFRAN
jgi:hypothetical protein